MTKKNEACGRCGKDPAEGVAYIEDVRYCHGDYTPGESRTCYMKSQSEFWDDKFGPIDLDFGTKKNDLS